MINHPGVLDKTTARLEVQMENGESLSDHWTYLGFIPELLGEHSGWPQWPLLLLLQHLPPENWSRPTGEGGARGLREEHQGESWHPLTRTTSHFRGPPGSCWREHRPPAGGQTFPLLPGSPVRVSLPLPERRQSCHQESRLATLSVPVSLLFSFREN